MVFISLTQMHVLNTGRFIMFSVITNIYNKKTKGRTLMELFTAVAYPGIVFGGDSRNSVEDTGQR